MVKVSVIIPAYNAAKFIRRTLDSVFSQTYQDIEIVVVDDGSTDETVDILRGYGAQIKWVSQKHQGQAAATNLAISMAQGDYLSY